MKIIESIDQEFLSRLQKLVTRVYVDSLSY
jgi:hypothetical protein